MFDPVSVVEAAYSEHDNVSGWLRNVHECSRGYFPEDSTLISAVFDLRDDEFLEHAHIDSSNELATAVKDVMDLEGSFPPAIESWYRFGSPLTTTSSMLDAPPRNQEWFRKTMPPDTKDFLGIVARLPAGFAIQIGAALPESRQPSQRDVEVWSYLSCHISTGFRHHLGANTSSLESSAAVLSIDGTVEYAAPAIRDSQEWHWLLHAASRRVEKSRGELRTESPRRALRLWEGLVSGTFSLIEQIDTDGTRYYVARKNDPEVAGPRKLSERERQVAAYVGLGQDNRSIAYTLGLSESTVATYVQRAKQKLGVETRTDLIRLLGSL